MPIKEQSYKVADHVFSLLMDKDDALWSDLDNYSPFLYNGGEESVFTLELFQDLSVEGKRALYISNPGWLKTSSDFSKAYLKVEKAKKYCVNNALMLLYAFRTAGMSTLEMHASVTVKDGKGFLFLGQSGTGKSTHSSLWLKNIHGTHLLNDDNPVVRVVDGKARVYGSPWSGKTPCYRNEDYPIGAFVRINRAPYNAIHRQNVKESFASISSSSSGLRAIRSIGDGLFTTISSLIQSIPCYVLDCLPDDDAAFVCSNEVLKNG